MAKAIRTFMVIIQHPFNDRFVNYKFLLKQIKNENYSDNNYLIRFLIGIM